MPGSPSLGSLGELDLLVVVCGGGEALRPWNPRVNWGKVTSLNLWLFQK